MKVLVAMSGGVDSAVSAFLLRKQGYEVVGVHFKMEDDLFFSRYSLNHKVCCSPDDTSDAIKIAKKIDIPIKIIDLKAEFRERIIKDFIKDYQMGITPNPCAWCNKKMKFWALEKIGKEFGIELFATGHYAFVKGGKIYMGSDTKKDQSYFLSLLTKDILKKLILPVGEMKKEEVRKIAIENELLVGTKPDSQDICFIPDGNLKKFFENEGIPIRSGPVKDIHGNIIGTHEGYQIYARGQRKGVGIAAGKRVYVIGVDPATNTVIVGDKSDLVKESIKIDDLNLLYDVSKPFDCMCKLRSTGPLIRCRLDPVEKSVLFYESAIPVAGQVIAFYKEKELIGGAIQM
ncbi:MAG: tRNA 2-thiouridine(34) synthase MnmA [Athalassotoga sp.]|uniref:tRNA 2-thiouridine(34) synthase MnmA n=1 Tax=Athalassotoga sp. TaxID=2022597 RepID=UPI003D07E9A0